jgi:hypothetical protein
MATFVFIHYTPGKLRSERLLVLKGLRNMSNLRWLGLIPALLLLCACGGGSGGGGESSNNSAPGFSVSLNQSALSFDYTQGAGASPQIIAATWRGEPPGDVYVGTVVEGVGISQAINIVVSNTNATAQVWPAYNLQPGEYTGRILFLVCSDPACTNRIGGSPLPVSYSVRVRAPVLTSLLPISFRHVWGAATPSTLQALTTTTSAGNWTAMANAQWIQLSAAQGSAGASIGVSFNPTGMSEGTYTGRITVTGENGNSQSVSVQLIIDPPALVATVTNLNFAMTLGTTTPDQTVGLTFNNQAAGTWTATVPSWAVLDQSSGTAPYNLRIGVNRNQPPASGNYSGDVVIDAAQGGRTFRRVIPITLSVTRPSIVATGATQFYGTNGSPIADQSINVTLSNGVIVPINLVSNQSWIVPRVSSVMAGDSLSIGIDQTAGIIAPNQFTGSITASTVLQGEAISLSIPVSLVLGNPSLVISYAPIFISGINGTAITTELRTVRLDNNAPFTLEVQSNQPWLHVTDTSTGTNNSFTVSGDPSIGPLAAEAYEGQITVGARLNGSLITAVRPISATMSLSRPQLSLSASSIALGGRLGRDATPTSVNLALNTGTNNFNWTVSNVPPWLELDRTSGQTSAAGQSITLTPRPSNALPGTSSATLLFRSVVNGDTVTTTLPISLNRDSHKLVASEVGVALASIGSRSRLSHSINVRTVLGCQ